jgi:hypothetical protein
MTSRFLPCLAAGALGLLLLGCEAGPVDSNTQERRDMGKQEAITRDFKKVSDCGALEDKEEQYGCAEYIRSLED